MRSLHLHSPLEELGKTHSAPPFCAWRRGGSGGDTCARGLTYGAFSGFEGSTVCWCIDDFVVERKLLAANDRFYVDTCCASRGCCRIRPGIKQTLVFSMYSA